MPSRPERVAAPLYLELAPPADAPSQVEHLFIFRDDGQLSGRGSGRFATDLFTLSATLRGDDASSVHMSLAPPRPDFIRRRTSFFGIVAGLRLSARPELLPPVHNLSPLGKAIGRVRHGDDDISALVAPLDRLARALSFPPRPHPFSSARTQRRRTRADTGLSGKRLAAIARFRHLLGALVRPTAPLCAVALDAGYYDQSHMSAACRAFAGAAPGDLRGRVAARGSGRSIQEPHLGDRLTLLITNQTRE